MNKNPLIVFLKYLKNAKKEFLIGILLIFLGIFTEIISVKIISKIFDKDLINIDKNLILKIVIKMALIYLFVKLIEALAMYFRKYYLTRGSNIVYQNIQEEVYNHVQSLPISYFDNIPAGSILSKITSDVNQIRNFFRVNFVDLLVTFIKIISLYTILFIIDYKLSIIILIFTPLIFLLQYFNKKITYKYMFEVRKLNSSATAQANEMLQNLEVVKAFNKEKEVLEKWEYYAENRLKVDEKTLFIQSFLLFNAFDLVNTVIKLSIIFYYVYSEYNKLYYISISDLIIFLFYISYILIEIQNFIVNLHSYNRSKGAAKNLDELLKLEGEKTSNKKRVNDFKAKIKFENVSFAYKDEEYVLKDINLEIKENETIAFVGHTGSGKSTIMNLLIKFYENQKGNIYINDINIKDIDSKFLRENISIVLQDSFLFEGDLKSNITDDEEIAKNSLITVGAEYILNERGINAEVSIDGANFSTGEKQLISFARAIAKNPKILILDEATSNIDSKTEKIIQKGIENLSKGRTTLIIAHRLSTIRNVDRIYVLDKGIVKEVGNHEELVKLNGIYKKMLDRDMKVE